jgi:hypothetical protein
VNVANGVNPASRGDPGRLIGRWMVSNFERVRHICVLMLEQRYREADSRIGFPLVVAIFRV